MTFTGYTVVSKRKIYVNPNKSVVYMKVIHAVVFSELGEPSLTLLIASDFTSALPPGPEATPPFIQL